MNAWRIISRLLWGVAWGILEGTVIILVYFVLLPALISYAAKQEIVTPLSLSATGIAYVSIVVGLSSAARTLEDTVYEPVLHASSNLYAFIVYVYYALGKGMVTIGGIDLGNGYTASITIDLTPMAIASAVLILLPGTIIPFIRYYGRSS